MADHPLRPAKRLRLGRPLPHQLADATQAPHPVALAGLSSPGPRSQGTYAVLAVLSDRCPPLKGRLPTCYSPVRRCTQGRSPFLARLACVKPAANVRSEPGSNSPCKEFEPDARGDPCGPPLESVFLRIHPVTPPRGSRRGSERLVLLSPRPKAGAQHKLNALFRYPVFRDRAVRRRLPRRRCRPSRGSGFYHRRSGLEVLEAFFLRGGGKAVMSAS